MTEMVSTTALLQSGVSPDLAQALRAIGEETVDGAPRFPPAACGQLARVVACRAYAPALLELCHLAVVADAAGDWEEAFWGPGPVRADRFRALAQRAAGRGERFPRIAAETHAARIAYADGLFSVSLPRAPLLAALLELLVSTIGFVAVDDALEPLLAAPRAAAAGEAANALSRALYDHLRDHLPTAQVQRKMISLTGFLEQRGGALDDDTVLAFWLEASADPGGGDFRTFAAVTRAFVNLWRGMDMARDRQAVDSALPLEDLAEVVDALLAGEEENPLETLAQPPADAIKFLNGRETADLEPLVEAGGAAAALPLSLLRCEVFGRHQNRLVEATRRRLDTRAMGAAIEAGPEDTYAGRRAVLDRLRTHLERVLRAAYHVLARDRRTAAGSGTNRDAQGGAEAEECARAFRGLSRRGFGEAESRDPAVVAGFAAAVDPLLQIRASLAGQAWRLDILDPPAGDWRRQFDADRAVFLNQFHLLYGGTA